jgi:hypothetical protein
MELEDLAEYEGTVVTMANIDFKFDGVWRDMSGEWATFSQVENPEKDESYFIYATLNYDGRGIPIDVLTINTNSIDVDQYSGEVTDWKMYVALVKAMVERIIFMYEASGKTALERERENE